MTFALEFSGFRQQISREGIPFIAKVYEGEKELLNGFNTTSITLDLSERSLLKWQIPLEQAERAIANHNLILWQLNLALLEGSLEDESRFLTLQLNMRHFVETVMNSSFSKHTLGISLFTGSLTLSNKTAILDYLKSLASLLPEETLCFIFIDLVDVDLKTYFSLMSEEFGHLIPVVNSPYLNQFPYAFPALGWKNSLSPLGFCSHDLHHGTVESQKISQALCLPAQFSSQELERALNYFGTQPFRVIPELQLTNQWEGIDTLFVLKETYQRQGIRALSGFEATGGTIISF